MGTAKNAEVVATAREERSRQAFSRDHGAVSRAGSMYLVVFGVVFGWWVVGVGQGGMREEDRIQQQHTMHAGA